ncbi:MAG: tripartite tricarboxylate transporter substrate binding protein [Betaproteobacteria bacterium]|nr:tripartite tricarboxylate transporter substrate binding protein [Betaproteobacteria bacterium]
MVKHALCLLAAAAGFAAGTSYAQGYPNKPIRWVVPYTPGGITDTVTRLVTQKLQTAWNQPITVENRPGANSLIGAELVAKSPADGYVLLTVIAAHAANATLYAGKMPFDAVKSFAVVSHVASAPIILTAANNLAVKDMRELIAYAKANPGKLSFGSSGIGAAAHLTTELLKQVAGIDMVHVPFKGTAGALQALMSGDIQILGDVPSSMMPHVRSGKIKALGLFSNERIAGAQEVPTVVEAGGPAIESATWVMILAPAGTPADIVNRISQEIATAIASADLRDRLTQLAIQPIGRTPEASTQFLNDEIAKWRKVIVAAGVKAEQ